MNALSRRAAFGVAAGGYCVLAFPLAVKAQDVIAVLEAAADVAQILQKFLSSSDPAPNDDYIRAIFDKLSQIIRSQNAILEQLTNLSIDIGNLLQNSDIHNLDGYRTEYAPLILQPYSGAYVAQYDALFHDLSDACGRLVQDNYAAFTAYASGMAMLLALGSKMFNKSYLTAIKQTHLPLVQKWLDASNAASITYLVNATTTAFQTGFDALRALPNPQIIAHGSSGSGGGYSDMKVCGWDVQLVISGDFNSGYTGAERQMNKHCDTNPFYMGPHGAGLGRVAVAPFGSDLVKKNIDVGVPVDLKSPLTALPPPSNAPSNYVEVNQLNERRNAVIDAGTRLTSYIALQTAIQQVATAFAS